MRQIHMDQHAEACKAANLRQCCLGLSLCFRPAAGILVTVLAYEVIWNGSLRCSRVRIIIECFGLTVMMDDGMT